MVLAAVQRRKYPVRAREPDGARWPSAGCSRRCELAQAAATMDRAVMFRLRYHSFHCPFWNTSILVTGWISQTVER